MSGLDQRQRRYLQRQRLGRLATVDAAGHPQVNPVSCYYNARLGTIDIGGHNMATSRKFRNVTRGGHAAVVIDDLDPERDPPIRCLEVRGPARAITHPTDSAAVVPGAIIRIQPERVISWGLGES